MSLINFFLALLILATAPPTLAQSHSAFKRTTATILFASIGGGVLGLSTLSFYGKPQEHTDNITTGVLIGFVAGLSYVMYDTYGQQASVYDAKFYSIHNHWISQTTVQKKRGLDLSWPLWSFHYAW